MLLANLEEYGRANFGVQQVSKDKIIYVADIFSSKAKTPVMVPRLWVLSTHDGKKEYVPKPGT